VDFTCNNSIVFHRNSNTQMEKIIMGDMKHFVEDFLDAVNNELQGKYKKEDWSWDNLPPVETMFQVMNEYKSLEEKKR